MSERDSRIRTGWILLVLLALTVGFACHSRTKTNECVSEVSTPQLPESAAEMAVFLRDKLPGARIVSTRADGQIDRSFFLTIRDSDENTLRSLPRVHDRIERWRHTVMCELLVDWQPAELFLEEWREYGFAQPPFVFFGDTDLLAKIKEAIR